VFPVTTALRILSLALLSSLVAAAAASGAAAARLKSPQRAEIANAGIPIHDSILRNRVPLAAMPPGPAWGGTFTASTGEPVTIFVSRTYPEDPAVAQRWADFLASLIHGSELSSLTAYLAPSGEVSGICGPQALACYSPSESLLVAPGDDPASDLSAEAVVTHEYGHHVAAHRSDAPWAAVDYGTKRWSSYEQVCAKTRAGDLFPGAETLPRYQLNPGEAFAESYRVLNERKAGVPEAPWDIVSQSLYPDSTALTLLEQDVTTPWTGATTTTRAATARSRVFTIATPLDGTFTATLRGPAKRLTLDVTNTSGTRLARAIARGRATVRTTLCGQRSVRVRVSAATRVAFRLTVARP
jgi:hypothetical protein